MQFRDSGRGDVNDLQLAVRDLNQQLRDRKQACIVLKTELDRIKRINASLHERLAAKEMGVGGVCRKGEAVSMGALRQAAISAKGNEAAGQEQLAITLDQVGQLRNQVEVTSKELDEAKELLQKHQDSSSRTEDELRNCKDALATSQVQAQAYKQEAENANKAHSEVQARLHQLQDESGKGLQHVQAQLNQHQQTLEQCKQEHRMQMEQCQQEHSSRMEALRQELETSHAGRAHSQKAGLEQALAEKDASLQSLRSCVSTALDSWSIIPPEMTVVWLGGDELASSLEQGRNMPEKDVQPGAIASKEKSAGAQYLVAEEGNCIELVLHDAILLEAAVAANPAAGQAPLPPQDQLTQQGGQQNQQQERPGSEHTSSSTCTTGLPRVLLLQLCVPGIQHTYRKLLTTRTTPLEKGRSGCESHFLLNTLLHIGKGVDDMRGVARGEGRDGQDMQGLSKGVEEEGARRLLELANVQADIAVHDLQLALLGGFNCPSPPNHPKGAGQLLPLAACALKHPSSGLASVELFECATPEEEQQGHLAQQQQQQQQQQQGQLQQQQPAQQQPGQLLQQHQQERAAPSKPGLVPQSWLCSLSADWRGVLPKGIQGPTEQEFVVDLSGQHPLIIEAARASGLFEVGRPLTGTDQHKYQIWSLQQQRPRALSTDKYLSSKGKEVAAELAPAAQPLAAASFPLSLAFISPDALSASSRIMHGSLQDCVSSAHSHSQLLHSLSSSPATATTTPPVPAQTALTAQVSAAPTATATAGASPALTTVAMGNPQDRSASNNSCTSAYAPSPTYHNTQQLMLHGPQDGRALVQLGITARLLRPVKLPPDLFASTAQQHPHDQLKAQQHQLAERDEGTGAELVKLVGGAAWIEDMMVGQVEAGRKVARLHAAVYRACMVHVTLEGKEAQGNATWFAAQQQAHGMISDLGPHLADSLRAVKQAAHRAVRENAGDKELAGSMVACTMAHVNRRIAQSLLLIQVVCSLAHFAALLCPLANPHTQHSFLAQATTQQLPAGTLLGGSIRPGLAKPDSVTVACPVALPLKEQQHRLADLAAGLVQLQQQVAAEGGMAAWGATKEQSSYGPQAHQEQQSVQRPQPQPQQQVSGTPSSANPAAGQVQQPLLLLPPPVLAHAANAMMQQGCASSGPAVQAAVQTRYQSGGQRAQLTSGAAPADPAAGTQLAMSSSGSASASTSNALQPPSASRGKGSVHGGGSNGVNSVEAGGKGILQAVHDNDGDLTPGPQSYEEACDLLISNFEVALDAAATTSSSSVTDFRKRLGQQQFTGQPGSEAQRPLSSTQPGCSTNGSAQSSGWEADLIQMQQDVAQSLGHVTAALIQQLAQALPMLASHASGIPSPLQLLLSHEAFLNATGTHSSSTAAQDSATSGRLNNSTTPEGNSSIQHALGSNKDINGLSARVLLSRLLVRVQSTLPRLFKGDPWGLPSPPVPGSAVSWVHAACMTNSQLQAAATFHSGLVALVGGHMLLCCGVRHEAVAAVLEAGGDEAQRMLAAAQSQIRLLSPGQTYGTAELQASATRDVMAVLPHVLRASVLMGHDLALQLLLVPLLLRQQPVALGAHQRHQHQGQGNPQLQQPSQPQQQDHSQIGSTAHVQQQRQTSNAQLWCGPSVVDSAIVCQELWPISLGPLLGYETSQSDADELQQQQRMEYPQQVQQEVGVQQGKAVLQPSLELPQQQAGQQQIQQQHEQRGVQQDLPHHLHSPVLPSGSTRPWSFVQWPGHQVLLVVAPEDEQDPQTGLSVPAGPESPQALALAGVAAATAALGWSCIGLGEQLEKFRQQQQQQQGRQPFVDDMVRGMSERDAMTAIAQGADAAILLGSSGSVPKWLAQQQVTLLPAQEGQDPALLRSIRAAGKAVAKHISPASDPNQPSNSNGRMGGLPQYSSYLPGTNILEQVAELARQLVARLCATHMQHASAVVVATTAGQPAGAGAAARGATDVQLTGASHDAVQRVDGFWHCALSTLYEDTALASKASSLTASSRAHTSKLASLLEGLQRSTQASVGHQLQSLVSTMVKDIGAALGQRQLLLEGLLLAAKQGAVVHSMLGEKGFQVEQASPTQPPSRTTSVKKPPSYAEPTRGLPVNIAQQQKGSDSTDSEEEETGVVQGRYRQGRGADSDQDSDAASVRTVSSVSTASYPGGRPAR